MRLDLGIAGQESPLQGAVPRPRPASLLAYVFLGGFLVAMLFPIYWIIVSSVKTRIDTLALPPVWLFAPTLEAYRRVFIDEHYGRYFVNTAVIAAATTLISLAVGSMAAYVLDRFRVRFSNLIAYALLGTRMIFPIVYAIPLFLVFRDLNLLDTHLGLIIAYTTFSLPYAVWIMAGFFTAVPREIDEAAMVDGCSRFGALPCHLAPHGSGPGGGDDLYSVALVERVHVRLGVGGGWSGQDAAGRSRATDRPAGDPVERAVRRLHGRDLAAPRLLCLRQQISRAGDDCGRRQIVIPDALSLASAAHLRLLASKGEGHVGASEASD